MHYPQQRRVPSCISSATLLNTFFAFIFLSGSLFAAPTITVISPKAGAATGSPIYYEAYASSSCSKGISAMRIYSAPSVTAYNTTGSHIETFIKLSPGSYSTVINAWDNCGGVATTTIDITVSSSAGVTVFLPSGSSASIPIHVAASAQNSSCAAGIASLRIYTSPGNAPYTIDSNQLDAFLTLAPGSYNLVFQAWDNCGHSYQSALTETATATPDRFLYGDDPNYIYEFPLTNGVIGPVAQVTRPSGNPQPQLNNLYVDPGGEFVYLSASSTNGWIYAYQIDHQAGTLTPVAGSPFNVGTTAGPAVLDPNGHFIYVISGVNSGSPFTVASYALNRSNGALTLSTSNKFSTVSDAAMGVNPTGAYVYITTMASGSSTEEISAYSVNANNGDLSAIPGNPYVIPGTALSFYAPTTIAWKYLYQEQTYNSGDSNQVWAYEITSDGGLTMVPGSPFQQGPVYGSMELADWLTRYLWATGENSSGTGVLYSQAIDSSTGALAPFTTDNVGSYLFSGLAEDHSGDYLYAGGSQLTSQCLAYGGPFCPDAVGSWTVGSTLAEKTEMPLTYSSGPGIMYVGTSR